MNLIQTQAEKKKKTSSNFQKWNPDISFRGEIKRHHARYLRADSSNSEKKVISFNRILN